MTQQQLATELPDAGAPPVSVLGVELTRGTAVSIRGKRGRFRFMGTTTTADGRLVLDFIGGTVGREHWHSYYPDRVTKIHPEVTMRPERRKIKR